MSAISRALNYLLHNPLQFVDSCVKNLGFLFSDKLYLSLRFRCQMGKWIDWKNPKTFNEKLQWLKVYNRRPEYTAMVDKAEAKHYAASIIGEEHIIPTLGVWDRFDEIDFSRFPDKFVLKTTNGGGGGGVVICRDKSTFDKEDARKKLEQSRHSSIYRSFREWPYKNVRPRIIAEQYMTDSLQSDEKEELSDYKFFCVNGTAHNVMLCYDRQSGDTKFYFFDRDWNLLRLNKRGLAAPADFSIPKPKAVDEMFRIAGELSKGLPFARVDLYDVNGKIYFGEITFYPQSGFDANLLPDTDRMFGDLIELPQI
jgi:hypothetical protein